MAGPVKAYAWPQGTTAGIVGPARSRIRQVVIYAETAGSFTMKNGTGSGDDLIVQPFPVGMHVLNIPDDGVLSTDGVYIHAFTGSNNDLTIFLS